MTEASDGAEVGLATDLHVEATNRLIEALVDAEKRMRRRIELLGDAVFETDGAGVVVFLSSAWSQITGRSVEDTMGTSLVDAVVDVDAAELAAALTPARHGFRVRVRFRRPDGRTVPTLVVTAPIEDGGVVGVVQDISQEVASQEELSMLSIVASSTDNYVVITDAAGNTEWVNPAFEAKTGYTLREIIGRRPGHVLQGPESDKATVARIREAIAEGRSSREELVNYSKDGSSYWVQLQITPVRNEQGTVERYISVQIDVTRAKELEQEMQQQRASLEAAVVKRTAQLARAKDEAEAAARAKSSFVANMSHEMRTPLNAITGLTRLLAATELNTAQSDYVHKMASAAGVLMNTVTDVLDFSRVEADAVVLEAAPFRLSSMLRSVDAVVGTLARDKGLAFHLRLDPSLPEKVVGDRFRLEQVLINLAGNAVKFTSKGSVTVALRREAVGRDVTVRFDVADTGVGIEPGEVQRLFQPFTQADSSTSRMYGGTGLGLAIVQRLVGLLGGSVQVDTEVGRGSTFGFSLRFATVDAGPSGSDVTGAIPRSSGTKLLGVRVLVAEDNDFNQQVVAELLESEGALVTVVSSGAEALARVAAEARYDVVLMDVQMPGMDGMESTRRLRALQGGADLLVIAMTANAFDAHRVACLAAGMNDFETKPVDLERLCRTIGRWLPDLVDVDDEPAQPAAVDPTVLASLLNNDEVKVRRFGLRFVETTRTAISDMRAAVASGDVDALRRLAHGVRPAAASVGAAPLSQLAADLESAASWGHVPDAIARLDAIARELERVAEVLAR
ncbi:MAG: PAS domain S-box protein [Actinomycetota bacterium]